jgi:hypothetical protein
MLKSTLFGVAIAAFAIAAPLRAENVGRTSASAMTTTDPRQLRNVQIPGTDYKIDFTQKAVSGDFKEPAAFAEENRIVVTGAALGAVVKAHASGTHTVRQAASQLAWE